MKLNIRMEQCSAGWKLFVDLEGVESPEDIQRVQACIDEAEMASLGRKGWSAKGGHEETGGGHERTPEELKAIKLAYARRSWNRGPR